MAESKKKVKEKKRRPPATTVEAKENQMISLAVELAEKQLRDGSASSQVITHYLKLGTTRAELEKQKLERENELLKAKTENLQSQTHIDELYSKAIAAMQMYNGMEVDEIDETIELD